MYAIYTFPAYIIRKINNGESDSTIVCLSDDYGKIYIKIQSARKENSKHRLIAQPYTFVEISSVKGKNGWRLTGINEINRIDQESSLFSVYHKVSKMVDKLVQGEDFGDLYTIFYNNFNDYLNLLENDEISLDSSNEESLERILVLRILYSLGYMAKDDINDSIINQYNLNQKILNQTQENIKKLTKDINNSLRQTHLIN